MPRKIDLVQRRKVNSDHNQESPFPPSFSSSLNHRRVAGIFENRFAAQWTFSIWKISSINHTRVFALFRQIWWQWKGSLLKKIARRCVSRDDNTVMLIHHCRMLWSEENFVLGIYEACCAAWVNDHARKVAKLDIIRRGCILSKRNVL